MSRPSKLFVLPLTRGLRSEQAGDVMFAQARGLAIIRDGSTAALQNTPARAPARTATTSRCCSETSPWASGLHAQPRSSTRCPRRRGSTRQPGQPASVAWGATGAVSLRRSPCLSNCHSADGAGRRPGDDGYVVRQQELYTISQACRCGEAAPPRNPSPRQFA